ASLIERAVGGFLSGRGPGPPLGKFESEVGAMKPFNLGIRHGEAVAELGKIDLVLGPSGNVLARSVFETAVKPPWIVRPSYTFEREVRWLAHLEEEERMQTKIAERVIRFGGNAAAFQERHDSLHVFRTGVTARLPSGYRPLPGNPSVEKMLDDIGQKQ